jgi:hypothetical protein
MPDARGHPQNEIYSKTFMLFDAMEGRGNRKKRSVFVKDETKRKSQTNGAGVEVAPAAGVETGQMQCFIETQKTQ